MQPAPHRNAAGVQSIGDLPGVHALHHKAGDAHTVGIRVVEQPQAGEASHLATEALVEIRFVFVDLAAVAPGKADALQKSGNARQVQRTGFIPVGQQVGLEHALRGAAGAAHHQGFGVDTVAQRQNTRAVRPKQPLVAGHGYHVGTERLGADIQHTGGLGGVHQQGNAVFPADGAQPGNGLNDPGDIAGVAHHHQGGAGRDVFLQYMGLQDAHAVRRQHLEGDLPPGGVALEQAHHRVMLAVGAKHLIPLLQHAADGQVDGLGAVLGEHDALWLLHAQQAGGFLTAGLYHPSGLQGQAVTAPAGIAAQLLHGAGNGADHLGRLGKAGGGVIEVDHGFFSSFAPNARFGTIVWCGEGGRTMEEQFGIAAFRSRQQVMHFERALRRAGVPTSIITTPRSVSVGCGLSVRFELRDVRDVQDVYQVAKPGNLIGFYRVERQGGHTQVTPLGIQMGYQG